MNAWTEKKLRKILNEKYPDENTKSLGRIRTREKRLELLRDYYSDVNPKFESTRESRERGQRNLAKHNEPGKPSVARTKANLVRRWTQKNLPEKIRLGLCIVCNKLAITMAPKEKTPNFHWSCHQKWESTPEGRAFQSLRKRRQVASLPTSNSGRPLTEENLKISYSWAIQHFFAAKSYGEIAKENDLNPKSVEERVKTLIERFPPPHLVGSRWRRAIELIISAAK